MTSPVPRTPQRTRAIKVAVTVATGILAIMLINNVRTDGQSSTATSLSTASLLTLPGQEDPTPSATPLPTTAPVQLPTSTPAPTATVAPTSTAIPTATPAPAPTATSAPAATAIPAASTGETASDSVSVADAGAVAEPEATVEVPNPTAAEPTATAVVIEPTATPTVEPTVVIEASADASPAPTATVEPTPEPTQQPPLQSAADLEAYVLSEINGVRASSGLPALALDGAASAIARDWSQQMADGGFFEHRPGAQLGALLPAGWLRWAENIASAPDIFWAQSSLEASPGHYENMVGPFTQVGIGVYTTGNQVWVTQVFVRY